MRELRYTDDEIRARLARRITQMGSPSYRDMEKRMNYSHQAIQRYVSGATESIPAPFLANFCAAYPTDVVWLVMGLGTPEVDLHIPAAERAIGEIERVLQAYRSEVGGNPA